MQVTRHLPPASHHLKKEIPTMAHGRIIIDAERCKGCELCREACPPHVISLSTTHNTKGYRPVVLLDPNHECTGCSLCATVCPDACITVFRESVPKPQRKQPALPGYATPLAA
jgi:2-oxoglutarate ferredoxin oxidoreductase subunit delta